MQTRSHHLLTGWMYGIISLAAMVPLVAQSGPGGKGMGGGSNQGSGMGGGSNQGNGGTQGMQGGTQGMKGGTQGMKGGTQGMMAGNDAKSLGALLDKNAKLSSNVQGLLPQGTDLHQASAGFKNLGQFMAAVHVSHNLEIPFDQFKAEMVGSGRSLGQAIHKLKPTANAVTEAAKAQRETKQDMTEAGM